jgi:tRNA-specific 2-thiouridylase
MSASGDRVELAFTEPVSAICPGQSLVLYQGSRVLGGGVIDRSPRALPVAAA